MKRLLNTLYVMTQGAYLARDGDNVTVSVEREVKQRFPIHLLGGIVCFGNVSCSPFLLGLCAERDVAVSFLTEHGRFLARVHGPVSGNVLLRRAQYRRADQPEAAAAIVRAIVCAKVANGRNVLLRAARERDADEAAARLGAAADHLQRLLRKVDAAVGVDSLRGLEGDAARCYFGVFDDLIAAQKDDFSFRERSRRPPLDPVNALLSFLYTLLTHDMRAALEGVGLDPAVGFLHVDRPGRPGLALDLIEELRPFFADRIALTLINRQQLRAKDFQIAESGAVQLTPDARKELLTAYQKRKQEEILHPFIEEKIPIGLLPHVQALLMARHLRGDLDGYPPFLWK